MNLKSNNPFLSRKSFAETATVYDAEGNPVHILEQTMDVKETINKSILLFAILVASAIISGYLMLFQGINPMLLTAGGGITGFVLVIIAAFKPQYSGVLAPGYSIFKGLFVGGISIMMEVMYPGIVIQAVGGTMVTFMVCFLLYRFGIVKVTEQFKSIVIAATLAIATYYVISFILSFFGVTLFHHGNSLVSIGFSVFVIIIAALNLFLDFDLIEQSAKNRLPKYMEWFGAMGLMITLVWLYIEFLRLLSKLRD